MKWSDYYRWMKQPLPDQVQQLPTPLPSQFERDSRAIQPGDWYVPLRGEHFDGHDFIEDALKKGASGFFYEPASISRIAETCLKQGLPVNDTLTALQNIARGWRLTLGPTGLHRHTDALTLIALTGSSGKTTTKEMIAAILREAGNFYAPKASFNNELGVPLTLLALKPEHRYAVSEFGARNPGNIQFLCELANPNIVALINVGSAHVGVFGSYEKLLQTKAEIFQYSDKSALAVANRDQEEVFLAAKKHKKHLLTFGVHKESDIQIVSQTAKIGDPQGDLEVVYRVISDELTIRFKHYHEAYGINGAAAIAVSSGAGISLAQIKAGLEKFTGITGRFQIHRQGRLSVVDDAYNANPHSMMLSLSSFTKLFNGPKILVLGDMLELGPEARTEHEKLGTYCATTVKPRLLITVGSETKALAAAAISAGLPASQVQSYAHIDDLLREDLNFSELGEAILIKGSNGIKLAKLVEQLTTPKPQR